MINSSMKRYRFKQWHTIQRYLGPFRCFFRSHLSGSLPAMSTQPLVFNLPSSKFDDTLGALFIGYTVSMMWVFRSTYWFAGNSATHHNTQLASYSTRSIRILLSALCERPHIPEAFGVCFSILIPYNMMIIFWSTMPGCHNLVRDNELALIWIWRLPPRSTNKKNWMHSDSFLDVVHAVLLSHTTYFYITSSHQHPLTLLLVPWHVYASSSPLLPLFN